MPSKEITGTQGRLELEIEKQAEIRGIGMGVLRDGTPFLNQRGLAALCGVQNAHIGTLDKDWSDPVQKPRITTIKDLIAKRGPVPSAPSMEAKQNGRNVLAYPGIVCLAVIEYYALDAGVNCQPEARDNFRTLAGKGLEDFIYTQVGYSPDTAIPEAWQSFHDRVTLTYNSVPFGHFGVFKEIADLIVTMIRGGAPIDHTFVPDISVGIHWGRYWDESNFDRNYGPRIRYLHHYPDYFPQSGSNPQTPWAYPDNALGEFRRWMHENYLRGGKFEAYLGNQKASFHLRLRKLL